MGLKPAGRRRYEHAAFLLLRLREVRLCAADKGHTLGVHASVPAVYCGAKGLTNAVGNAAHFGRPGRLATRKTANDEGECLASAM